jgi:YebC/PmpR family DNA-binding regulatory protein
MAGHSKWANIQHRKGRQDAKRGKLFSKLIREVTVSARLGGPDPDGNPRLRAAIDNALAGNMPKDTIERAVKRGAGGADGESLEEVRYEGYGPGGVAVMVDCMTDNRNRTVAEVRSVFNRIGGNMGEAGSVAWLFEQKGVVFADVPDELLEDLALAAIDAGADDVKTDGAGMEVHTPIDKLEAVREGLQAENVVIISAELEMVAKTPMPIDAGSAKQTLRLIDSLEDLDDVQKVYTNADFPDEVFAGMDD